MVRPEHSLNFVKNFKSEDMKKSCFVQSNQEIYNFVQLRPKNAFSCKYKILQTSIKKSDCLRQIVISGKKFSSWQIALIII